MIHARSDLEAAAAEGRRERVSSPECRDDLAVAL